MDQALRDLLDPAVFAVFPFVAILLVLGWAVWEFRSRKAAATLRRCVGQGVERSIYLLVHSGRSRYYFDVDGFLADAKNVRLVGSWLQGLLEDEQERGDPINCLAFIEKREGPVGSLTLKEYFGEMSGLPSITIRLRKRVLGLSFKPYSVWQDILRSKGRILLLSDVATTGGTLQQAIAKIRSASARVDIAAVIHDREEKVNEVETKDKLLSMGIQLKRFSTMSSFTADMVTKAREAGLLVYEVKP